MKTPDGRECRFYYEDYYRGRDVQECRLEKENPNSARWQPSDCSRCPVPEILRANSDPDMKLTLTIHPGFLGFFRRLEVTAHSRIDGKPIADPYIGRLKESPQLDLFRKALEEMDDDKSDSP
jgi:hypothetical protein